MKTVWEIAGPLAVLAGGLLLARPAAAACAPDAVQAGPVCIDKYEASVWRILPTNTALIAGVQAGTITSAATLTAGGAGRKGESSDDYDPGCPDTAAHCTKLYAVSIPGVKPSAYLDWFQAVAVCRNAGKRLATNQEWQMAAFGTPDPGTDNDSSDCNVSFDLAADPTNAGSRSLCVSDVGAFDMVGNLTEWVADWGDIATGCTNWPAAFGSDVSCVGGDGSVNLPGALIRGGEFGLGSVAGVFAAERSFSPSFAGDFIGFRCARAS